MTVDRLTWDQVWQRVGYCEMISYQQSTRPTHVSRFKFELPMVEKSTNLIFNHNKFRNRLQPPLLRQDCLLFWLELQHCLFFSLLIFLSQFVQIPFWHGGMVYFKLWCCGLDTRLVFFKVNATDMVATGGVGTTDQTLFEGFCRRFLFFDGLLCRFSGKMVSFRL